jgi:hypothetical protein
MAKVRLTQMDAHTPWQEGELVTLQVVVVKGDGEYECETHDTYPPGLKEQHAAELAALDERHVAARKQALEDLHAELTGVAPSGAPVSGVVGEDVDAS